MKKRFTLVVALATGLLFADEIRFPVTDKCREMNHIEVVNVGGAVSEKIWNEAIPEACGLFSFVVWTNSVASLDMAALATTKGATAKLLGEKAKLAVFLIDDDKAPAYLASAGEFAVINLSRFKTSDKAKFATRVKKAILQGMALSAGCGAGMDGRCALYEQGFSDLAAFDATNVTIAPMTYFPLTERVREIGGDEMVNPEFGVDGE